MIPAPDIVANYGSDTDDDPLRSRPVVAFDDVGRPLVLGDRGLVPAESLAGFRSLAKALRHTVIPGAGWMATLALDGPADDGCLDTAERLLHVPVVAWLIDDEGDGVPLVARSDGSTAAWDGPVFHPEQAEAEVEPPAAPPAVPGFDPSTLRPRQRPERPDSN